MKNATLPIAVGVAILGCVLAVYANLNSSKLSKDLDEERYKRLTAEQQLQNAQQKIGTAEAELGDAKSKMASIENILTNGKTAEKQLMGQLDELKMQNEALKQQLTADQEAVAVTPEQ